MMAGMSHHRTTPIVGHGRNRSESQTPDLFSTEADPSRNQDPLPEPRFRRPALPKDLPKAIRYLADEELVPLHSGFDSLRVI